jgi:hypothetical protein
VHAGDERQQIAKNARDSSDGFWNRFPTFWSADGERTGTVKIKKRICTGAALACANTRDQGITRLLEFIGILTPQRFQSMNCQNRNEDHVAFSYPFLNLYTRAILYQDQNNGDAAVGY